MQEAIDFVKYPNLILLLWDRSNKVLEAKDAFSLLDCRLHTYLRNNCLTKNENDLVRSLAMQFGGGICGTITVGIRKCSILPADVIDIIKNNIDLYMVKRNHFLFGGNSLCSYRHGEYRRLTEIEFFSSYKNSLNELKLRESAPTDLKLVRDIYTEKDFVRAWADFKGKTLKIDFVHESRFSLEESEDIFEIPSLNDTDLLIHKMLSGSDHGFEKGKACDLIDIFAIYRDNPQALEPAWMKAYSCYGSWLVQGISKSLTVDNYEALFKKCGTNNEMVKKFLEIIPSFKKEIESLLRKHGV